MDAREELRLIQRVVGETLIPEAREAQTDLFSEDQAIPIALELIYTAFALKASYRPGGLFVARRFAERMGLDAEALEQFAVQRLNEVVAEGGVSDGR